MATVDVAAKAHAHAAALLACCHARMMEKSYHHRTMYSTQGAAASRTRLSQWQFSLSYLRRLADAVAFLKSRAADRGCRIISWLSFTTDWLLMLWVRLFLHALELQRNIGSVLLRRSDSRGQCSLSPIARATPSPRRRRIVPASRFHIRDSSMRPLYIERVPPSAPCELRWRPQCREGAN